jgi:cell division protein FtsZ
MEAEEPAAAKDELLLDASRLAEEDGPVSPLTPRRRGIVSNTPPGNTLFERMANLSRGVKPASAEDDEDDDDDDSASISIPRFLGRQNNQ